MKKFYVSLFATVFLLSSFLSQGQVYNSILSNPLNYTLDDFRYWQGGVAPPTPCTNCTINIFSDVSMVQNGFSSDPANNCGGCTYLNDIVLNGTPGGSINVYGNNVTLTINTYLELFNTTITIGNDPTSVQTIKLNDQVDMNGTAYIRLANDFTTINANDIGVTPIAGPHDDIGNPGFKSPGIFGILAAPDVNGYDYSQVLNPSGLGKSTAQYQPNGQNYYTLNCDPFTSGSPNTCGDGFVFGPAETILSGSYGIIFIGAATLPVQLVQFLANKNDDGTVKLSWSTAQEQNSDYFDVERSSDQSSWTKIGSVKAKGYSSITANYSFTDKSPADGNNYYHLKMVDLDGKFKYSKTVSVSSGKNSLPLVIYSNPFNDQIRMKVNVSRAQNLIITVSDVLGKTYVNQSYHAQEGDNFINLQPNAHSSATYILRIHGDSYDQTVKLEKQ